MKTSFWVTVLILFAFMSGASGQVKGLLDGMGLDSEVSRKETNYSCSPLPPPKPPAQHSGAEGAPPLPLPAVPLRRTEKKNPPRPPVLVVKVITERGEGDWNTNPNDVENLLRWMSREFGVNFSSQNRTFDSVFGMFKRKLAKAEK